MQELSAFFAVAASDSTGCAAPRLSPAARPESSSRSAFPHASWPALFVVAVWVAMLMGALVYVGRYGSTIPAMDDMEMVPLLGARDVTATLDFLWQPHNEHRFVLPRLVFLGLLRLTHDFRSALYFQVVAQAALALALLACARRLRGRVSSADAFFPLLLLHWGNAENFLLGLQISTSLATALTCAVLMLLAARRGLPTLRTSAWLGVCVLLMPLCGGFGLCQLPPLALWLGLTGIVGWRAATDRPARHAAAVLVVSSLLALALVALYFHHFRWPEANRTTREFGKAIVIAGEFLTLNLGPVAHEFPRIAIAVTFVLLGSALALLVHALRSRPAERYRAWALLFVLAAPVSIALSVGASRQIAWPNAGWADRYVMLPAPLFATIYFVFLIYAGPRLCILAQGFMCSLFLISIPQHVAYGRRYGWQHESYAAALRDDLAAGRPFAEVARRNWEHFYSSEAGFKSRLTLLAHRRLPPFEDPYFMFGTRPLSVSSTTEILPRVVDGRFVIVLRAPASLCFSVPHDARTVSGRFGLLPSAYGLLDGDASDGVCLSVELVPPSGSRATLLRRVFDPARDAGDRGLQLFAVELPDSADGQVVLRLTSVSNKAPERDWGAISAVLIE